MKSIYLGESWLIRQLRALIRDRLTVSGRVVFWCVILTTGVGLSSLAIRIYLLWAALICFCLVSIVGARLARTRLRLSAEAPQRATAGVPVAFEVLVEAKSLTRGEDRLRWFCDRDLERDQRHLLIPALAPGQTCRVRSDIVFPGRGLYRFPRIVQENIFPFGWWRDLIDHSVDQATLVYPSYTPLSKLDIPVGRRYQPGGISLSSYLGDSTEFLSTREFREGDSIRSIHWKSWARLGKPIVKEYQEEYFCRIALILDTFALDAGQEAETFEAAVSISAAVADYLSQMEYVIDIFAAGPEIYHFQAGRSLAYFQDVMDILACIEASKSAVPFESLEPVLLDHLENITTTVVVLLDWDPARERLLRTIRERGSEVKVVLVREGPPKEDVAGIEEYSRQGFRHLTPTEIREGVEEL